jgi:hypothetical protein
MAQAAGTIRLSGPGSLADLSAAPLPGLDAASRRLDCRQSAHPGRQVRATEAIAQKAAMTAPPPR